MNGSVLRIRTVVDISKPLRRSILIQIEGEHVEVSVHNEKLPLTCLICGMVDHVEEQCSHFRGRNDDDLAKPYGRWFQNGVIS